MAYYQGTGGDNVGFTWDAGTTGGPQIPLTNYDGSTPPLPLLVSAPLLAFAFTNRLVTPPGPPVRTARLATAVLLAAALHPVVGLAQAPTADPAWHLVESGYDPSREAQIEACFAIGNGLLGVRASRAISRGPTWITDQHHLTWASWPRTYVAGLYDTPNVLPPVPGLVPAPDWLRLRVWVNDHVLLLRSGELHVPRRTLDLRRGPLLTDWVQKRAPQVIGPCIHPPSAARVRLPRWMGRTSTPYSFPEAGWIRLGQDPSGPR